MSLVRETIRTQALRWSMEGDVLVLRLASFTGSVTAAMEKAIAEATAMRDAARGRSRHARQSAAACSARR